MHYLSAAPRKCRIFSLSIFILFFKQVFQIILTETNRYFHQYMSSRTTGSTAAQPSDITIEEMYTFFGLIIQIGNDQCHSLKDYREEQYCPSFYSYVMARNHFFHILRFLHFENSDDPDYNRLWKIRKIFDTLNNKLCELYNLTTSCCGQSDRVVQKKSSLSAIRSKET